MKKSLMAIILAGFMLFTMTTTALAAENSFNPSVKAKPAPEIVSMKDKNGNSVSAIIRDANGNEVEGVPAGGLTITPLSKADQVDETIKSALVGAYNEITALEDLGELDADLAGALTELDSNLEPKDLVVRDLVDVTLSGEYNEMFTAAGNSITLTFDLGIASSDLIIVAPKCGDKWVIVPAEDTVINGDGTVTVTFREFCPVAFFTSATAKGSDVISPQTGSAPLTGLWLGAAGFGIISLACIILLLKKRPDGQNA